ncbi:MAG: glycosyltransferase family 39 protein, partial [Anaerolineae bacterium]
MSNRQDQPYGVISLTLKRWNRGILITLLLVAFTLRALPLDVQGLWRDEVDALRFATAPLEELLGNFDRPGWNGPLYFLILRGWILLTGRTAFAMRYFSLLWSIVGIALFYVLGRRVVGQKTALWALPLVIFSPYLVWYAQEVKMYTWVPTLVLLALYALDRACTRPRWVWWAVVLATTSMAFYSHILAALLIPVEVIWFLLHPRRQRRAWIGGLITLALLTLPYVPLLRWQWREVWKIRETGFPTFTLEEMIQILLTGWSTGIAAWASGAGAIFFSTLALFGLVAVIYWQGLRRELTLLTWLLLPLFAIWAVSQQGPIFTDRYLIWTAPAFYLLVSA